MVAASNSVMARRSCSDRWAGVSGRQALEELVIAGRGSVRPVEKGRGLDHSVTHPGPQLAGGGPGEGDDQQFRGRDTCLGQVPGGQAGQGIGLAGPGTCLDGRDAARKPAGEVERTSGRSASPGAPRLRPRKPPAIPGRSGGAKGVPPIGRRCPTGSRRIAPSVPRCPVGRRVGAAAPRSPGSRGPGKPVGRRRVFAVSSGRSSDRHWLGLAVDWCWCGKGRERGGSAPASPADSSRPPPPAPP